MWEIEKNKLAKKRDSGDYLQKHAKINDFFQVLYMN
jgi:hypothetical protein